MKNLSKEKLNNEINLFKNVLKELEHNIIQELTTNKKFSINRHQLMIKLTQYIKNLDSFSETKK